MILITQLLGLPSRKLKHLSMYNIWFITSHSVEMLCLLEELNVNISVCSPRVALLRVCASRDPLWTILTPFLTLWNWPMGPIKISWTPWILRDMECPNPLPSCSHQKLSLSIQKDLKMNKLWHRKSRNLLQVQVGNTQNFGRLKLENKVVFKARWFVRPDVTRAWPLSKWNDEGIARVISSRKKNGHARGSNHDIAK